jgi:hypothetical protein
MLTSANEECFGWIGCCWFDAPKNWAWQCHGFAWFLPTIIDRSINRSRLSISLVEFLPENNVRTTVGCRYLGREPNFHHFST